MYQPKQTNSSGFTLEAEKEDIGNVFSVEDGENLKKLSGGDPKKMFEMVAEMGGYLKKYDGVSVKHIRNIDPTVKSQVIVTFPNGEYLIGETAQNKEDFFDYLSEQIKNNNPKSKAFWDELFQK